MTKELRRIRFDEFADNLARFFALVSREHEPVVVENDKGESVILRPLESPLETSAPLARFTEDDYNAFRAAFGGWSDVDTEALKAKIKASRQSSRPPVTL